MQSRAVGRQAEDFAGKRQYEFFHTGFALRAFGDTDQRNMQPELFPYRYGYADLPFAAVNQHDIRPFDAFAVGFGFLHFAVTARQHFAHGGVVVAGLGGRDVVAAVLRRLDVLLIVHNAGRNSGLALRVADIETFKAVEAV